MKNDRFFNNGVVINFYKVLKFRYIDNNFTAANSWTVFQIYKQKKHISKLF